MKRFALVLGIAAVVASAAGAKPPRSTHDVLPVIVDTGAEYSSVGVDFFSTKQGKTVSLARSLAVFARLPRTGDALPERERHVFAGSPLMPEPDKARLLLSSGGVSIYAEPTKQGSVCYFLVPRGNGGCVESLLHGALPQVTAGQVWGLMSNAAAAVSLRAPGSGWSETGPAPGTSTRSSAATSGRSAR